MFIKSVLLGLISQIVLTVFCDDHLEKSKQMTGSKRDESEGILTSDPFLEAAHFWPFDKSTAILTTDLVTGSNSLLMNGASITKDSVFNTALDTHQKGSYAIVGDFNGTCFSDPGLCKLGGMTVYMWLKINRQDVDNSKDQYILSSGGQSKRSRGFCFLNFHGEFTAAISTENRQWKLKIDQSKIKYDQWMQATFVWNSNTDKLFFYLNDELVESAKKGVDAVRMKPEFTIMTISRPNNAVNKEFMMPLNMAYFALWDKPLTKKEIDKAFKNVKQKIDESRRRRTMTRRQEIFKSLDRS